MSETHPVWRTLAQADAEEIEHIRVRAIEVLAPFLDDAPSVMGLSQAICDIWPMLFIHVEGLPTAERQRAQNERHEDVRQNWSKAIKTTTGIDMNHATPSTPKGVDL